MLCGRRALRIVEVFSICTCGGGARVTRPGITWVMADRARGGAFDLVLAATDAGALDGFKEKRVSRALRLLFITDATGLRRAPHRADLRYMLWARALAVCEAFWLNTRSVSSRVYWSGWS